LICSFHMLLSLPPFKQTCWFAILLSLPLFILLLSLPPFTATAALSHQLLDLSFTILIIGMIAKRYSKMFILLLHIITTLVIEFILFLLYDYLGLWIISYLSLLLSAYYQINIIENIIIIIIIMGKGKEWMKERKRKRVNSLRVKIIIFVVVITCCYLNDNWNLQVYWQSDCDWQIKLFN